MNFGSRISSFIQRPGDCVAHNSSMTGSCQEEPPLGIPLQGVFVAGQAPAYTVVIQRS